MMDPRENLEKFLDEAVGATRPIAEGEVTIARWADGDPVRAMAIASRKLAEYAHLQQQLERAREVARQHIAAVQTWLEGVEADAARQMAFLENLLRGYAEDFHGEEKTVKLPGGVLRRRKNRSIREWDEEAALEYQRREYPDDLKVSLNKQALLKRLKKVEDGYINPETGEIVPFIREVEPEEAEKFVIETEGEA